MLIALTVALLITSRKQRRQRRGKLAQQRRQRREELGKTNRFVPVKRAPKKTDKERTVRYELSGLQRRYPRLLHGASLQQQPRIFAQNRDWYLRDVRAPSLDLAQASAA